jgi:hypothetical protein
MIKFKGTTLSSEDAFWVMWYFLKEHYDSSSGQFDVSDILSASEPTEFDIDGHIDGNVLRDRNIAPADSGMISSWNEAIEKFEKEGIPPTKKLKD